MRCGVKACFLTVLSGLHIYSSSDHLPRYLLGPEGHSYKVNETAFHRAMGTDKPLWEWMTEKLPPGQVVSDGPGYPGVPDLSVCNGASDAPGAAVGRPELENFALAMVAGGKTSGAAHAFDFPWQELGEGLVVDVGGGVGMCAPRLIPRLANFSIGGFPLQLMNVYPKLKFVVQDRPENVERGEHEIYPKEAPEAVSTGRVTFQAHDFFEPNPVKNADVYWLRGILWVDLVLVSVCKAL